MALTLTQIRERAARALGLFQGPFATSNNSASSLVIPRLVDVATDDEQYRNAYLWSDVEDDWRRVSSVSGNTVTLARAFTNTVNNSNVGLYGLLSPDEWNAVINEESLPSLYYIDRAVITINASNTEYNVTNSATWLKSWDQVIRSRFRNDATAGSPTESEAPIVYPVNADDHVLTVVVAGVPQANDGNQQLIFEARRYYGSADDANATVNAPEVLLYAKVKHAALKKVFQKMGAAAKRVYGQAMVLAERELAEQEARFQNHTVRRDWSDDTEPISGNPEGDVWFTW